MLELEFLQLNVNVKGHSQLKEILITSQAEAEKNPFRTGSIVLQDIQNHRKLETQSVSVSVDSNALTSMNAMQTALSLFSNQHK